MTDLTISKPRSVELKNNKEREISFYQKYLDDLAQGNTISSEIFNNKGEAHASILMATLLANTTKTLKLYCQGLTPGILCGKEEGDGKGFEGAYWAEFKWFFQDTIRLETFGSESVQILIQKTTWLENKPFEIIKNVLKDPLIKEKIKVKQITDDSKLVIEKFLGNNNKENYNFAIFDGKAFRLEYNPEDYQAIGSFNNPTWCNLLTKLFDYAFLNAKDINLNS